MSKDKPIKLTSLSPKISLNRVDEETNTLHGIQVMNIGLAEGHGMRIDKTTIEMMMELGGGRDIKTYFGHPAASSPRIGTDLGILSNFSDTGKGIIGDLRLFKASMKEGGNGTFTQDMALNDPEHIGNSVELKVHREAKTVVLKTDDILEGYDFPVEDQTRLKEGQARVVQYFMRPTLFASSAIVSKGAATDKLFSAEFFGGGDIAHKITAFLDANEDVREVLTTNPDIMGKVTSYLSTYKIISKDNLTSKLTNKPHNNMDNGNEATNLTKTDVAETVEAVLSARAKADAEAKLQAEATAAGLAAKKALDDEIAELKANNEKLAADLAAAKGEEEKNDTDASGEGDDEGDNDDGAEAPGDLAKLTANPAFLKGFESAI
tara:strand:+ start:12575 stop:13708 length:1134 start_codon:yes stop_codon:yes gene_type:complete